MELINNKGETKMSETKLNFINDYDGIFLEINDGKTEHYVEILTEEQAEDYIISNVCVRDLDPLGTGTLKMETDLVWVYVGVDEEFFMTGKDNYLLSRLGIADEAERLIETELEKFCKAKKAAA